MFISSRNKMPFPEVGRKSGGSQDAESSDGTGIPLKSVGAS